MQICEKLRNSLQLMAIEHYSSLASNRNYKIHNASVRVAPASPQLVCTLTKHDAIPKQLAQIKNSSFYLHPVNYSHYGHKTLID